MKNNIDAKALELAVDYWGECDCPLDSINVEVGCKGAPDKCHNQTKACWMEYFRGLARRRKK